MIEIKKEDLLRIIYVAIDEFNEMQEDDEKLEKATDTVLFSRSGFTKPGVLDSMGLVNFLITLDEIFDREIETVGLKFDIQEALDKKENVMQDVNSLISFILSSNTGKGK